MTVLVYSYTIYHSPNAYLGTVLLRRALANAPGIQLIRQPIYIPRERGVLVAELLGGKENRNVGSYLREDCRRWSERFSIPFVYPDPEIFHRRVQRWAVSPFHRENCRPVPSTRPMPKSVTCSIKPCSKRPGSRGSTSTTLKPFGGPRSARASTLTT